jgi:hypothetical protein
MKKLHPDIEGWVGNAAIFDLPKTAFLCSRSVPASTVLKAYDWAAQMRKEERCVIGGFHSAIEQDVFRLLLRGEQPVIMALARGMKQQSCHAPGHRSRKNLAVEAKSKAVGLCKWRGGGVEQGSAQQSGIIHLTAPATSRRAIVMN